MKSIFINQSSVLIVAAVFIFSGCRGRLRVENDYGRLRKKMIVEQIERRGIKDRKVLDALYKIERHLFVDEKFMRHAYDDTPLPIGRGQTISQPYIVALMTELLQVDKNDKVLEIGTGSGYQAAVLALLAEKVYTIEIVPELGLRAEKLLKKLNFRNIEVKIGDGYLGWPEKAPFDKIILTCAPPKVPSALIEQLKDGGLIVAPVGEYLQELVVIRKNGSSITERKIIPVRFVPMIKSR